jgi:pectate lyase
MDTLKISQDRFGKAKHRWAAALAPLLTLTLTLTLTLSPCHAQVAAFPGAEGFGATASGGRGGQVIFVTNTNISGPGSLKAAVDTPGPKYILFRCSGVIDGTVEIPNGSHDITIAGQTSPNGIVVRGLSTYNELGHSTDNLIIRHIRSRCSKADSIHQTPNWVSGDGITLGGVHKGIVDHCSFGHNVDEAVDISRSTALTIQNCLLTETIGEHNYLGGMLTNYSDNDNMLDSLSIHHNTWSRIGGRLPEFSCEFGDCNGHTTHAEISCNLYHDQGYEFWYNSGVTPGGGPYTYYTDLNFVNNYSLANPAYCNGMFLNDFLSLANNDLYLSGNKMNVYPNWQDYELMSCCNDFCQTGPNTDPGVANHMSARHNYPAITYTPTNQIQQYAVDNVGAFPRDAQDQRIMGYVANGTFLNLPLSQIGADDPFTIPNNANGVLPDGDNDGMPDYWESAHGLNPAVADHNGTNLSVSITGVAGYTNLECYLNCLADALVQGGSPSCGISLANAEAESAVANVNVYPNPGRGRFEVSVRSHVKGRLQVYDLQGHLIWEQETSGRGTVVLDLRDQPAGIYILRLGAISRKLVLE